MSPARLIACGALVTACLAGAATAAIARPLKIVHQAPVAVPADLDPKLGRVLVQLDVDVAADGAVADVRLLSVSVVAEKVEMTADPDALKEDFDAMVKASIASVRQWRFEPPASAPAVVRVPVRFDITAGRTAFGSIRPMSGYAPDVTAVLPSGALKVGGSIHAPKKLVNVAPTYPEEALQQKVQGAVVLDVVLDAEGVPSDVQVVKGVPLLDAAAIEAVRQWRYEPTLMNGVAVPVAMTVTVNFELP